MNDVVMVQIPVSREAAEALADEARRERVGKLVSELLRPTSPETDPLLPLIRQIKATARGDGLTNEEIDAELAVYNAERRV